MIFGVRGVLFRVVREVGNGIGVKKCYNGFYYGWLGFFWGGGSIF